MIPLPLSIATAHLRARKRQTMVSVLGVTLGVGVFIAIGGMMQGFQGYFRAQIIDTNPHILISDEIRRPAVQPLQTLRPHDAVQIVRILPRDPVRGISASGAILDALSTMPGVAAAPTLRGQMILRRAGRDYAVTALGIDITRELRVTNLKKDMVRGRLEALAMQENGLVLGQSLARKMGADLGDTVIAATAVGGETGLRIVGMFNSGLEQQDLAIVYVPLARQQSMQARPRVVNEIHIRLDDIEQSIPIAQAIEGRWGYKTAPWEETYARILSVFKLQNAIIYGATGSILLVAGFGIFNIISTVVLEKGRDIAIMRSIGLAGRDIVAVFVIEGMIVGVLGVLAGWGVGFGIATFLRHLPAPGAEDPSQKLMVAQSLGLYTLASSIALITSIAAAWLPARKAAATDPLDVIRGAT